MVVDNLSCCDHRTWGSFLALEHQFSVCLSCFLSWSISCRPSAVTSPHSLSASTTRCFVQLDQSPTSCVLGFHLPHLAAPSLPVASSSLLVIFISFSRCSFYFNRSLFFQPMLLDAVQNMFGALTLLYHCRFFAWIYSGKPANASVPLVSPKLWTAITLFVEQIYSLKEAERKYTFYFFCNSRRLIRSSFWLHKKLAWLYWLQFCSLHVTAKTMQCKWFSSFLLSAL